MKSLKQLALFILYFIGYSIVAQNAPYFLDGEDPSPEGTKWKLIKKMSDEFNGNKVNEGKWQISDQGWIGRAPGLFQAKNVTVSDGNLKITAKKLPNPIQKEGKTFTHGGGYAGSWESMTYGYYECKMKANKTFMSSTFWLINERKYTRGCDRRTTELDIQECVGQITTDEEFAKKMVNHMNSNTHSRNIPESCNFPEAIEGAKAPLNDMAYDNFHVYGVWWKNKDEVLFFLDGKFQSKIKPAADFNIPMHLRLVVETYNWNPVPADGGMNMSVEDRTTYYDWVRSWRLKG